MEYGIADGGALGADARGYRAYIELNKASLSADDCNLLASNQALAMKNLLLGYEAIGIVAAEQAVDAAWGSCRVRCRLQSGRCCISDRSRRQSEFSAQGNNVTVPWAAMRSRIAAVAMARLTLPVFGSTRWCSARRTHCQEKHGEPDEPWSVFAQCS
jgi:hypothetical protein